MRKTWAGVGVVVFGGLAMAMAVSPGVSGKALAFPRINQPVRFDQSSRSRSTLTRFSSSLTDRASNKGTQKRRLSVAVWPVKKCYWPQGYFLTTTKRSEVLERYLGLIRDSALVPPLLSKRILKLTYSLFVPRERLSKARQPEWHSVVESVPLALQASGGQFQRTLEESAKALKVRLEPALCRISFTQSSRAVLSGNYAAILPSIAVADLSRKSSRNSRCPFSRATSATFALPGIRDNTGCDRASRNSLFSWPSA